MRCIIHRCNNDVIEKSCQKLLLCKLKLVLHPASTLLSVTTIRQLQKVGSGQTQQVFVFVFCCCFLCPLSECRQTNQIARAGVCG